MRLKRWPVKLWFYCTESGHHNGVVYLNITLLPIIDYPFQTAYHFIDSSQWPTNWNRNKQYRELLYFLQTKQETGENSVCRSKYKEQTDHIPYWTEICMKRLGCMLKIAKFEWPPLPCLLDLHSCSDQQPVPMHPCVFKTIHIAILQTYTRSLQYLHTSITPILQNLKAVVIRDS